MKNLRIGNRVEVDLTRQGCKAAGYKPARLGRYIIDEVCDITVIQIEGNFFLGQHDTGDTIWAPQNLIIEITK